MSAVVNTLRRVSGRNSDVAERLAGLESAVQAAQGRLDPQLVAEARGVVDRAGGRLKLSGEHTVVALAGATGSGKSSLFNALCGLDLAAVGVRRPTTSWALACSWGPKVRVSCSTGSASRRATRSTGSASSTSPRPTATCAGWCSSTCLTTTRRRCPTT
ncbi:MAG: GTPase [Nocardioidaceae bacterium]